MAGMKSEGKNHPWERIFIGRDKIRISEGTTFSELPSYEILFAGVSIGSVARRLGHASMTTTQKTYLHIIQELDSVKRKTLKKPLHFPGSSSIISTTI